ncbi:MAG: hypothetical protein RL186_1660, partial [Pseudomonadota bacterium]
MEFCDHLWRAAEGLRRAVHAHRFNQELAAGTLSRAAFAHYMVQDSLYLRGYAKILALAAAKAPSADEILACTKAAQTAIVVERAL